MTDFQRSVARFSATDIAYIVDVLQGAYTIVSASDNPDPLADVIADFIDALDECDCVEIVEDEEMLRDEN